MLLRPAEDGQDFEVLLQHRAQHLRDPGTWGLVGGQLDWEEWCIYHSDRVGDKLRSRVLRRAALREALEEMSGALTAPHTPILFEPMCVQIAADGKAMHLRHDVQQSPVPNGLSFLEMDETRSRQLRLDDTHTYVFVYLIDALRDGEIFMGDGWRPKEPHGHGEVDQSKGIFGYEWRPVSCLQSHEDLQPWLRRLGGTVATATSLRRLAKELVIPRPQPEICWGDGLRPLLQLLAVAFESGLVWQQCDQTGCTLQKWAEGNEVVTNTVKYFKDEAPTEFGGRRTVWSGKVPRTLRLCADAVQGEWETHKDEQKFTLKDWEDWHFKGETAKQKWMKERGQVLRKLLSSQPVESGQPQRVLRWPKVAVDGQRQVQPSPMDTMEE